MRPGQLLSCTNSLLAGLFLLASLSRYVRADEPWVTALVHLPKNNQIVAGSTSTITILRLPQLQPVQALPTKLDHVHDLSLSPDQTRLLAVGGTPGEIGLMEIWELRTMQLLRSVEVSADVIYGAVWLSDGSNICTAGADGVCRVLTIDEQQMSAKIRTQIAFSGHSQPVLSIQLINGKIIASMGADQTIRIWSPNEGGQTQRVLDNHVGTVLGSSLWRGENASQSLLATVSEDKTVRLWQPSVGRLLRFARLPSAAQCVCWSQDGKHLFVGCCDGRLRVIESSSARVVAELNGISGPIQEIVPIGHNDVVVGGVGGWEMVTVLSIDK